MRDYGELVKVLRMSGGDDVQMDAADAIEELVALAKMNDWCRCKNCSLQHFDSDGLRWCEELSMVVGGDFSCGYFEGTEPLPDPPKEDA